MTLDTRFWSKVRKTDGCWEWSASVTTAGYGKFLLSGRLAQAHRLAYESARGPIPDGMVIDHLCRNRACVNPDHLEVVRQSENVKRGVIGARTHCKHGHELAGDNLWRDRDGHRHCKTCMAASNAAFHRRERERRAAEAAA